MSTSKNDRARLEKLQARMTGMLEEGEQVQHAGFGSSGSAIARALGPIGLVMFLAGKVENHALVLTDRNLLHVKCGLVSAFTPKEVLSKHSLGSVRVTGVKRYVEIDDQHLFTPIAAKVTRDDLAEIQRIANAAHGD
jgi:hypothetical protein